MTPRCACGQPAPNASICQACERDLTAALIAAITLGPDLDTALARQTVFSDRTHTTGHTHPLPYDPRVSEAATHLHDLLGDWYDDLSEAM